MQVKMAGRYDILLDGEKVASFDNMLLNTMPGAAAEESGSLSRFVRYLAVGSGSTPPDPGDTGLESFIAYESCDGFTSSIGPPTWGTSATYSCEFSRGEATGNISEVGAAVLDVSEPNSLGYVSRSLIRDQNGDPTTITVTDQNSLVVRYTLYLYPPTLEDTTFTMDINGTTHNCVMRPFALNDAVRRLRGRYVRVASDDVNTPQPIDGSHSVSLDSSINASISSSSVDGATVTLTYTLSPNDVPDTGYVGFITFGLGGSGLGSCNWQITFDPLIEKDNEHSLSFTVEYTFVIADRPDAS